MYIYIYVIPTHIYNITQVLHYGVHAGSLLRVEVARCGYLNRRVVEVKGMNKIFWQIHTTTLQQVISHIIHKGIIAKFAEVVVVFHSQTECRDQLGRIEVIGLCPCIWNFDRGI